MVRTFSKSKRDKNMPLFSREFNQAMSFVRQTLEYEKNNADKIVILDYIMKLVKEDIKSDLLSTVIYQPWGFEKRINIPFPLCYEDELGNQYTLEPKANAEKEVDLKTDCVLVLAWDRERMRNSIKNIFYNPFRYHDTNHLACYFEYIDLCYAHNGTHSISAGLVHRKGTIVAPNVYDVRELFEHIYTDGLNWYNQHNKEKLSPLFDFRVGVLFEISKLKYELEQMR